ncbi:AtzE family amidohydrolase [Sphaerotilus mobilis]|uniref:Amidase/aspartyl-tRNA(Asn)/glutamyl-tRNA(Gln) amidotransferase subunit A n=1 Tax=Sphaerotilus mobilis TaxID=47994 RepID=A0A4Q7LD75_9BURK|nr:AtzE family amidohydrolase [Sphaerotilus mobilis]RZS52365.1 amidase/aspartyl-tRNA(Asn)/glutamyl-tRNA(Gln) amidotransferase subunit A [Sphaerotilus mobilis]
MNKDIPAIDVEALLDGPAHAMADAVRCGHVSARTLTDAALARIAERDPLALGGVNACTAVLDERARREADAIDARLAAGDAATAALPLLGVPYAVKNLFDVAGIPTLAGSKIERDAAPAAQDGLLLRRLQAAGAVLLAALNMDEYAYGFTTENSHAGACRNPHDHRLVAGGSSGGSAAAIAAGEVPLTLGSDTNGSIRVPSSLCGVFGLKPTFGRLPRTGSYPFVASLDHLGPFGRSTRDLALAYDAMQGHDAHDAGCVERTVEPVAALLETPEAGLRVGVLGGWFHDMADEDARAAVARVAEALRMAPGVASVRPVHWPEVERARAAAFLITNVEGANLHLDDLRRRPEDFEPLSRDRFLAGALLPATWVVQAQRVRRWFARQVAASLADIDLFIAPATPCVAPAIGSEWITLQGQRLPARPSIGVLTQPVSCIGLPVCAVPVWGVHAHLPIGVQLIAAPWREDRVLRAARLLELAGTVHAPVAAWPPRTSTRGAVPC